ncbi:MAG: recombinase family protein [Oscillospiraceae bacterium]|nr:recombinase family protein [Oscillospiraceae bacterium]
MLKNRSIPFGYCVVNGSFAVNEIEAEAVRKIFADYICGKSLKTIAAEMKIPYNSGKTWNKNTISRILDNKKYTGENGCPRIISDEDFLRVSQIKSERNKCRKPALRADLQDNQQADFTATEYVSNEEIERISNEIKRLLQAENSEKETIENLILKCAKMKYSAIIEVKK